MLKSGSGHWQYLHDYNINNHLCKFGNVQLTGLDTLQALQNALCKFSTYLLT